MKSKKCSKVPPGCEGEDQGGIYLLSYIQSFVGLPCIEKKTPPPVVGPSILDLIA